jgi:hypothetical protein
MALKPCKECGREISTEAKLCPHCGKTSPTGTRTSPLAMGCLVLMVLVLIFSLFDNTVTPSRPSPPAQAVPAPPQPPPPVGSQWHYFDNTDEMTGKISLSAYVESENTVQFDFPYEGPQHGTLTLRRHPRYGSDVIFSIEKGQLMCSSYDGCTVLIRFDNEEPSSYSAGGAADNSTETIFIRNYDRFLSKLRNAKQVRISPKIYQQGGVVFTFDVSGFDVTKLRRQQGGSTP